MKRAILVFLGLLLLFLNVRSVNTYLAGIDSINQVEFSLIGSSLTQINQGVYQFTATVQNTGDPATTGVVPISWEEYGYTLVLTNGVGTLDESVADYDINGDDDKDDTFTVEWNDTIRPWDAEIDGVYIYALADHSENRGFNRTYSIDGKSKLFQLGNKMHTLYYADNDTVSFGFGDAVILNHPSPNFELVVYSDVSFIDITINGEAVEVNYTRRGIDVFADGTEHTYSICVVPNQASTIGTDDVIEFSCTIIARETKTCEVALLTNWSPDGNIRYRWVPFDQVDVSFEAINRPFFIGTFIDVMDVNTGVKQLEAKIKNIGVPATTGDVPISWEKHMYELPLAAGTGTLAEADASFDLNGDGDTLDSFDVTLYPNDGRLNDALINNGTHDIHAYSFIEEWLYDSTNRSYYIDGKPKLFQLGGETHSLYFANDNVALFGFDAVILKHPSPHFEVVIEHIGAFSGIRATDFKINGLHSDLNLTRSIPFTTTSTELWSDMVYITPNNDFEIDQDEEVTISCTFTAHEAKICDIYLIMNWSPDDNIRYLYNPYLEEVTFNLPDFILDDSTLASSEPGVYQLTVTIKNIGAPATAGTVPISWDKFYYELPLLNGEGILDESIIDHDLNGDDDKYDTFDVKWFHNETRQWDAIIDNIYVYSLWEGPPDDPRSLETYYIDGMSKQFKLGSEIHFLIMANAESAQFGFSNIDVIDHPSPNFELYFNTTELSADNFKINGVSVDEDYKWSGRELYPLWSGEMFSTVYLIPDDSFAIDTGEIIKFSCRINVHKNTTCDMVLLVNWSPNDNVRLRWFPYAIFNEPFESPPIAPTTPTTTPTTPTTTPETTPTTSKTTSESAPTIPGFSFLTTLLITLPILVYIHRRKNT
ncbi:MAG: hypothetical protein ACFFDT_08730 [Candidatus Hodarchaeota archaeon]